MVARKRGAHESYRRQARTGKGDDVHEAFEHVAEALVAGLGRRGLVVIETPPLLEDSRFRGIHVLRPVVVFVDLPGREADDPAARVA